jgi:endonuclease/exonuclease/phosphatase family metal-dependent hydrolase
VVNLQEVWTRGQLRTIRTHLPSYPHVSWRRGLAGQPRGGLVTFSHTPVRGTAYVSFAGAPAGGGLPFRARQWLNTRLQGVLTTTLADVPVVVANTHLTANKDGDWSADNRHYSLQRAQLDRLHAAVDRLAGDLTVLCGDFNISSRSPLYPSAVAGYQDPFADADPWTFHVALLHPGRTAHRIDYLLVRGAAPDPANSDAPARLRSYQRIFDEPVPGFDEAGSLDASRPRPAQSVGLVSDHVGLTAEIEFS